MIASVDVLIVGAGPAGISCARALGGSPLRVLLLERNEAIGPKRCAGGLTRQAARFGVPEARVRRFPLQTVRLDSRPPFRIHLKYPLLTVRRDDLAQAHLSALKGAAAVEIRTGTRLLALRGDTAETSRGTFRFRTLVAADGSRSVVRRHLGLPVRQGIGCYYEVAAVTQEMLFCFRPQQVRSGYLWAFPHVDHTNVGIGFNPAFLPVPAAKSLLRRFMAEQGFEPGGARLRGGTIPYGYCGHRFGSIYLAGDAAGLASRATGEGIAQALVSGREIGKKILDPGYGMPELRRLLVTKRRQEIYWRVFERIPPLQAFLLASYFRLMKRPWMQSFMGY